MTPTQTRAVAERAAEHYAALRDRAHEARATLADAQSGHAAAEQARGAAENALQALAGAHLTGKTASEKALSAAISGVESAERSLRWASAVTAAAQRALRVAEADLVTADRATAEAGEQHRRTALRARVLDLAAGTATV